MKNIFIIFAILIFFSQCSEQAYIHQLKETFDQIRAFSVESTALECYTNYTRPLFCNEVNYNLTLVASFNVTQIDKGVEEFYKKTAANAPPSK